MVDDEKPLDEQQTEIMRNAVKALVPWLQQENARLRADLDAARALIDMLDEELALPIGHPLTQAVKSWMAKHPAER